jgi:hypothetical protein
VPADQQQRSRLLGIKLGALVRDHAGEAPAVLGVFGGGAALVRDGEAWVLGDEQPARVLGQAMAWARQQGCERVHVLAERKTGLLARRAGYFDPAPLVFRVEGRSLVPADPEPLPVPAGMDPALGDLVDLIEAGGAEPVVEHGVLSGEVLGLEVCRAVRDPHLGVVRLEVGVGAHDREAFQLVHGDVPPVDALSDVVAKVAAVRRPGGEDHPLRRLGAERLLRWQLVQSPGLVGAASVYVAQPPIPRPNLKDPVPCVAAGEDTEGHPVLVVCSVGIDLDLVPFAADARAGDGREGVRLLVAVPERDAHPVTRALLARLRDPAELVAVPAG